MNLIATAATENTARALHDARPGGSIAARGIAPWDNCIWLAKGTRGNAPTA